MKTIFMNRLNFLLILLVTLVGCKNNSVVNGIEVSELLIISANNQHVNYRKLLRESTEGNAKSTKELALLKFYDASGYDHGAVIVDLIDLIGEDKFIQSLSMINKKQKKDIEGYIEVGLEYGNNPKFQNKSIKEAFPKIYFFLMSFNVSEVMYGNVSDLA